jgi:hypothetical protein
MNAGPQMKMPQGQGDAMVDAPVAHLGVIVTDADREISA